MARLHGPLLVLHRVPCVLLERHQLLLVLAVLQRVGHAQLVRGLLRDQVRVRHVQLEQHPHPVVPHLQRHVLRALLVLGPLAQLPHALGAMLARGHLHPGLFGALLVRTAWRVHGLVPLVRP